MVRDLLYTLVNAHQVEVFQRPAVSLVVARNCEDLLRGHAWPSELDLLLRGEVQRLVGRELVPVRTVAFVRDALQGGVEGRATESLVQLFVGHAGGLTDVVPARQRISDMKRVCEYGPD